MKTRPLAFDSVDYRLTKALMIAVAAGAPLFAFGFSVYDALAGKPLRVTLPVARVEAVGVAPGVQVTPWGLVAVEATDASIGHRALSLLPSVVVVFATWVALRLLWRVVTAAAAGKPFTVDTVHCLRAVALVVFLGAGLHWLTAGLVNAALSRRFLPGEEATVFATALGSGALIALGAGLLFAMVAEICAHGVVLEGELEGLV